MSLIKKFISKCFGPSSKTNIFPTSSGKSLSVPRGKDGQGVSDALFDALIAQQQATYAQYHLSKAQQQVSAWQQHNMQYAQQASNVAANQLNVLCTQAQQAQNYNYYYSLMLDQALGLTPVKIRRAPCPLKERRPA